MNKLSIQNLARRYTDYDMIRTYTDLPSYPEVRTRLLLAALEEEGVGEERRTLYALVVSLVQMGLDTHQTVPVRSERKDKPAARSLQLKVLAGDYFSARYYDLLARAGEIEMIDRIASAICEVNRKKMNFYLQTRQAVISPEEWLDQKVSIQMEMFLLFPYLMTGKRAAEWPDLLRSATCLEILAAEYMAEGQAEEEQDSWTYWYLTHSAAADDRKQIQSDRCTPESKEALFVKYRVRERLASLLERELLRFEKIGNGMSNGKLAAEAESASAAWKDCLKGNKVLEER
ncbi:heptaprenyl diphosphate synthase component 1 [Paenibacillus sp. CC-CFT747]|nr:heptaprenyl diphosphate synthase component 1 [Paenibacillus sp. CC-CFT747]